MVEGKRYSFQNKQNKIVMIATLVSKDGGGALTIRREDPVTTLNLSSVFPYFIVTDIDDVGNARRLTWDTGLISSPSGPTDYSIDTADARRQTLSRTSPTIFGYSTRHADASPAASQAEMDASRTEGRDEMKAMGAANWRNENAYTTDDTRGNTSFNGVKRAQSSNIVDWNAAGNQGFGLTRTEANRGWGGSKKLSRKSKKSSKSKKSRKSKKSKKLRKSKKMRK
jgi:hypothetical protein